MFDLHGITVCRSASLRKNPPMPSRLLLAVLLSLVLAQAALGQDWRTPLLPDYGRIVDVPGATLAPDSTRAHRIAFDLASADTLDGVNRGLWYLARLRNLLHASGVPADSVVISGVIHGGATPLASANFSHAKRKTVGAADLALMQALAEHGVTFYVCGQSAASAGIALPEDLTDGITPAPSAMTTFVVLGERGYERL